MGILIQVGHILQVINTAARLVRAQLQLFWSPHGDQINNIIVRSRLAYHTGPIVASSYRRHRQDKTVGGVNWVRDSRRQFSIYWRLNSFVQCRLRCERICELVLTQFPNTTSQWIGNHVVCELATGWGQDKTQFTPHFETGQNCFEIFSHRHSWLVSSFSEIWPFSSELVKECRILLVIDFYVLTIICAPADICVCDYKQNATPFN